MWITIKYFFRWLKWKWQGSPNITYSGYHCGCCGIWIDKQIKVPAFTADDWWDTWGLCETNTGCRKGEINATKNSDL